MHILTFATRNRNLHLEQFKEKKPLQIQYCSDVKSISIGPYKYQTLKTERCASCVGRLCFMMYFSQMYPYTVQAKHATF
jgi:hypothetical protein